MTRTAAGTGLACDLDGDQGPFVVFPGNLFSSRLTWATLLPDALGRYRMLSYDLRNQGESPDAGDGFGLQTHLDDLLGLLDTHGIDRAWLIGTSLSAIICRDFAAQHPHRVAGMVLCSPAFGAFGARRRAYFIRSWRHALETGGIQTLFAQLYPLMLSDRAIQCYGVVGFLALREAFIGLHASPERLGRSLAVFQEIEDRPDRLQSVSCPVLLISGDADFLTGPTALAMTASLIPGSEQLVLPGAGHMPYLEMPDRFQQLLMAFIDAGGRPAACAGQDIERELVGKG